MIMNSASNKEVDILRMLTKAKDEYTKVRRSLFIDSISFWRYYDANLLTLYILKYKRFCFVFK